MINPLLVSPKVIVSFSRRITTTVRFVLKDQSCFHKFRTAPTTIIPLTWLLPPRLLAALTSSNYYHCSLLPLYHNHKMSSSTTTTTTAAAASASAASSIPAELTFVTGNSNKLLEVKAILSDVIPNLRNESVDLPELQGEPAEITKEKCRIACDLLKKPVLVEDTSLCFNALNGLPGPYIKWFLEKTGHQGLNNLLAAYEDKSAYSQCIFGYCPAPGAEVILFEGRCPGKIVAARGPTNFGWDPIFEADGYGQTFAELDKKIKNEISHRAKALQNMKEYFHSLKEKSQEK